MNYQFIFNPMQIQIYEQYLAYNRPNLGTFLV